MLIEYWTFVSFVCYLLGMILWHLLEEKVGFIELEHKWKWILFFTGFNQKTSYTEINPKQSLLKSFLSFA